MSKQITKMNLLGAIPSGPDYFIKNKDKVIGVFRWDELGTAKLLSDEGLPFFVFNDLDGWLECRTPPKHRAHMKALLDSCGLSDTKDILDFSKGLSLTDTLWVTSDASLAWDKVNLFRNEFDDTISRIAFDGGLHGVQFSTTSPEFGTDGMLPKCWVRDKSGAIQLIKAGTERFSNAGYEPLSEILADQVLTRLGYPHVNYRLGRFHGKRVSVCELMTSEKVMLLPIYRYYTFTSMAKLIKDCTEDGIVNGLAQMLIYDFLSWNTDRHAGNLGVFLDADTFELITFAKLWDHGCSMCCYWNGEDDMDDYATRSCPALYDSFEWGAKNGKYILGDQHNVERLINFEFDLSKIGDYSVDRVLAIQSWFQRRVMRFLEM